MKAVPVLIASFLSPGAAYTGAA